MLETKDCIPCAEGTAKLSDSEIQTLRPDLHAAWSVPRGHHLEREFSFKDFRDALNYTVKVGELAEQQGHHPDINLSWGKVRVTIWTHKVDGLTESDFILAKKIEHLKS